MSPGLVTQTKENPSHSHEIIKRWLKLLYNMYYFKLIFYLRGLSQKKLQYFYTKSIFKVLGVAKKYMKLNVTEKLDINYKFIKLIFIIWDCQKVTNHWLDNKEMIWNCCRYSKRLAFQMVFSILFVEQVKRLVKLSLDIQMLGLCLSLDQLPLEGVLLKVISFTNMFWKILMEM